MVIVLGTGQNVATRSKIASPHSLAPTNATAQNMETTLEPHQDSRKTKHITYIHKPISDSPNKTNITSAPVKTQLNDKPPQITANIDTTSHHPQPVSASTRMATEYNNKTSNLIIGNRVPNADVVMKLNFDQNTNPGTTKINKLITTQHNPISVYNVPAVSKNNTKKLCTVYVVPSTDIDSHRPTNDYIVDDPDKGLSNSVGKQNTIPDVNP